MHIQYLDNLLNYLETGQSRHHEKIMYYIHVLEDIGDHTTVKELNEELLSLKHQKGKKITLWNKIYPISILKEN